MILYIDTETELIRPFDRVRTEYHVPRLAAVGWATDDGPVHTETTVTEKLRNAVQAADTIVFHNAGFDVGVLTRAGLWSKISASVSARRVLDTLCMYRLRYPLKDRPASLAAACLHVLGRSPAKGDVRTSFVPGQPLSPAQAAYLRGDVAYTRDLYLALREVPYGGLALHPHWNLPVGRADPDLDWNPDVAFSAASAWRALSLEPTGLRIDQHRLRVAADEAEAQLRELAKTLWRAGLLRAARPSGSTAPVRHHAAMPPAYTGPAPARKWQGGVDGAGEPFAYRLLGARFEITDAKWVEDSKAIRAAFAEIAVRERLSAPVSPKTGALSIEYKYWKQYRDLLPEPLNAYLDFKKVKKTLSSFFSPLLETDAAVVHPQYWIPGAETGRWAASSPNVQQIPLSAKAIYRPPAPGQLLVAADYKSLELYTLANSMVVAGVRGRLLDALESGADIHSTTAEQMGGTITRQEAKVCNFGLPGGMGARTFLRHARAQGLRWTLDDAHRAREAWFAAYPEVRQWLDQFNVDPYSLAPPHTETWQWLQSLGWSFEDDRFPSRWELTQLLNGGRLWCVTLPSGRCVPQRGYSAGANCTFQGPGGDVITEAFLRVSEGSLDVAAVIHDSISVVVPSGADPNEYGERLVTCMRDALAHLCPHVPAPLPEYEVKEHL